MSNRSIALDDRLYDYLVRVSLREHEILKRLRDETMTMRGHSMQIAPEQGQFMAMMIRLIGARRGLEIGVFTGYSSLVTALALPNDGRLVALDRSEEWTAIAQRYWREAGVAHKIDLRLGAALDTLDRLLDDGHAGSFDFAFIDADKGNYDGYYERALRLVRPGGLVMLDNVLWGGSVADPAADDEDTAAIRALNNKIHRDDRVDVSLVPIGDGLTLARKR